jgi:undecaprenyl-diphosphatase
VNTLLAADHAIAAWINGLQGSPALDTFFLWGTELGTALFGILPMTVVLLARHRTQWRLLLAAGGISAASGIINAALKWYVFRPRPIQVVPGIKVIGPLLWGQSFPSGHTVLAFSLLAVAWTFDRRLGLIWLPCAIVVGISRVYLGVHFPSDVLFGAALGFVPAYFLLRRLKSKEAP